MVAAGYFSENLGSEALSGTKVCTACRSRKERRKKSIRLREVGVDTARDMAS